MQQPARYTVHINQSQFGCCCAAALIVLKARRSLCSRRCKSSEKLICIILKCISAAKLAEHGGHVEVPVLPNYYSVGLL